MKQFFSSKAIGFTAMLVGFLIVALWIVWWDNSNYGKWVDAAPWVGIVVAVAGWLYSRSKERK